MLPTNNKRLRSPRSSNIAGLSKKLRMDPESKTMQSVYVVVPTTCDDDDEVSALCKWVVEMFLSLLDEDDRKNSSIACFEADSSPDALILKEMKTECTVVVITFEQIDLDKMIDSMALLGRLLGYKFAGRQISYQFQEAKCEDEALSRAILEVMHSLEEFEGKEKLEALKCLMNAMDWVTRSKMRLDESKKALDAFVENVTKENLDGWEEIASGSAQIEDVVEEVTMKLADYLKMREGESMESYENVFLDISFPDIKKRASARMTKSNRGSRNPTPEILGDRIDECRRGLMGRTSRVMKFTRLAEIKEEEEDDDVEMTEVNGMEEKMREGQGGEAKANEGGTLNRGCRGCALDEMSRRLSEMSGSIPNVTDTTNNEQLKELYGWVNNMTTEEERMTMKYHLTRPSLQECLMMHRADANERAKLVIELSIARGMLDHWRMHGSSFLQSFLSQPGVFEKYSIIFVLELLKYENEMDIDTLLIGRDDIQVIESLLFECHTRHEHFRHVFMFIVRRMQTWEGHERGFGLLPSLMRVFKLSRGVQTILKDKVMNPQVFARMNQGPVAGIFEQLDDMEKKEFLEKILDNFEMMISPPGRMFVARLLNEDRVDAGWLLRRHSDEWLRGLCSSKYAREMYGYLMVHKNCRQWGSKFLIVKHFIDHYSKCSVTSCVDYLESGCEVESLEFLQKIVNVIRAQKVKMCDYILHKEKFLPKRFLLYVNEYRKSFDRNLNQIDNWVKACQRLFDGEQALV